MMRIQPAHTPTRLPSQPAPVTASASSSPFSAHVQPRKRTALRANASGGATAATASASPPAAMSGSVATAPPAGSSSSGSTPAGSTQGGVSAAAPATSGAAPDPNTVQSSLNQSEDQNVQFLEMQSQVESQSELFTMLSNTEKTESDTIRNTAQNMAI